MSNTNRIRIKFFYLQIDRQKVPLQLVLSQFAFSSLNNNTQKSYKKKISTGDNKIEKKQLTQNVHTFIMIYECINVKNEKINKKWFLLLSDSFFCTALQRQCERKTVENTHSHSFNRSFAHTPIFCQIRKKIMYDFVH